LTLHYVTLNTLLYFILRSAAAAYRTMLSWQCGVSSFQ